MKFRFVGKYTGGAESITMFGPEVDGKRPSVTFHERSATEVKDKDLVERLSKNPEFKEVGAKDDPGAKKAAEIDDPHNVPSASEEAVAESAKSIKS
jgi:hypothetical protein